MATYFRKLAVFLLSGFLSSGYIQAQRFYLLENEDSLSGANFLSRYLQIPSLSGCERAAANYLERICIENGMHITYLGGSAGSPNLCASMYPLDPLRPNVVFVNHMDVVDAPDATLWIHKPFGGEIADGAVWGRGALDNKGVATMQLLAVVDFIRQNKGDSLPFNVSFLSLSCEETQCPDGISSFTEHDWNSLNAAVAIGEGPFGITGLNPRNPAASVFGISVGNKQALQLRLFTQMQPLHGSIAPGEYAGKNMVMALHRVVDRRRRVVFTPQNVELLHGIGRIKGGVQGLILKNPRLMKWLIAPNIRKEQELFSVFCNSLTLTRFSATENSWNTTPACAEAYLDCRLLPGVDTYAFLDKLKRKLRPFNVQLEALYIAPKAITSAKESEIFEAIATSLTDVYPEAGTLPVLMPNYNDCVFFRARGIPAYDIIPVILDLSYVRTIHSFNEQIPIEALENGAHVYRVFLEALRSPDVFHRRHQP